MKARPPRPTTSADLSEDLRRIVVGATLALPDRGGQGVLVPGGFILTAAHCIELSTTGDMTLSGGEDCLERVRVQSGATFLTRVVAVEPVADIAVLGAPDNQQFSEDAEAFDAFAEATTPVQVNDDDFEREVGVSVFVLTHTGAWTAATVTRYGFGPPSGVIAIAPARMIEGGTSGGPVVNAAGELVGVVSWSGATDGVHGGMIPRSHLALPCWIWQQIAEAQGG